MSIHKNKTHAQIEEEFLIIAKDRNDPFMRTKNHENRGIWAGYYGPHLNIYIKGFYVRKASIALNSNELENYNNKV